MAAATALSASAKYLFKQIFMRAQRQRKGDYKLRGSHLLHITAGAIPTTSLDDADDIWVIADFSDTPELYLSGRGQVTITDVDGATALVWDLVLLDAAGATDKVLINDSTVGRAAGFDELDENVGLVGYNAGGKRLALKIVTAAGTPAAGTVTVDLEVYFDRIEIG